MKGAVTREGVAGAQQPRASRADDLVIATIRAHASSLLATARRHSLCADDAHDAYQRALEIFLRRAASLEPDGVVGWLHTVVKHEAMAVRRARQRLVAHEEVDFDAHESAVASCEEKAARVERVARAAEALQRLKPHELRALWLKAEGHSYQEIASITGWTYTKVNRCLTEGRRSFLDRYAGIESGAECERWAPLLSAMVDGEATTRQVAELRPHLKRCSGCRATVLELHRSAAPLAAVLPVSMTLLAEDRGGHVTGLLTRLYEAVAGGVHERVAGSAVKIQAAIDAAGSGKVAAVAASAAAVAGGGITAVDRVLEHPAASRHQAAVSRGHRPARARRASIVNLAAAPEPSRPAVTPPAPLPAAKKSAGRSTSTAAQEFAGSDSPAHAEFGVTSSGSGDEVASSSAAGSSGTDPPASAASSEFGG